MPRLLAVGHVTRDRHAQGDVLGGSVTYSVLAARKLDWEAAVLTAAGPDFEPERELPGVRVFVHASPATTRFANVYDPDGRRRQVVSARAEPIELTSLPDDWRAPDVLLLAPVLGEIQGAMAGAFEADLVGATAQGWLRALNAGGEVCARDWDDAAQALAGVHVVFLSEHDLPAEGRSPADLLAFAPMVGLTRGWKGATLLTRSARHDVVALPRPEVDPTGAGDVFAASFLVRYHETGEPLEAAAFASCAASCAVEGMGASSLGDRAEVQRRLVLRQRLIEEGEWDE